MKLILLPGMDGTGKLFKPLLEELDESINPRVIIYPQDTEQGYESLTDWVFSQLPQKEEFVLLGESFSGPIAFNIAAKKLPNLIGVIFVATFLENPRPSISWLEKFLPLKFLLKLNLPDFFSRKLLLGESSDASLVALFWEAVTTVEANVLQRRLSSIVRTTKRKDNIVLPCVYIAGKEDYLVLYKNVEAFRENCSNLSEHFISGPHFLLQAKPKVCARIIKEEIERISNSTPTLSDINLITNK